MNGVKHKKHPETQQEGTGGSWKACVPPGAPHVHTVATDLGCEGRSQKTTGGCTDSKRSARTEALAWSGILLGLDLI